jgi:hypothetical protein
MWPHFIEKKVLTLAAAQRMVIAFSSEIERVRSVSEAVLSGAALVSLGFRPYCPNVDIVLALVAFVITAGPLSTIQPRRIDAFVPVYATALFLTDLITAELLFAKCTILRSRALVAIASGYLFTALIVIPWMLTFPGVFAAGELHGAGLQSANWLYIVWHVGFPIFMIAFALLKDADPLEKVGEGFTGATILWSVVLTVALVCAATFGVTAGNSLLPSTMLDPVHFSTLRLFVAGFQILLSLVALIVPWNRRRSALDLLADGGDVRRVHNRDSAHSFSHSGSLSVLAGMPAACADTCPAVLSCS